jgi:non-ribosomal peptide synthetase component E (peptide arylation enzyme)
MSKQTYVNMIKPELAQRYVALGHWMNKTFFDFIEGRVALHPDREVFADARRRISYAGLKDEVLRCAELYRRIGIKRGDVVTVQLPNRIEFAVAFFALELIGAIANKVNPDFRARELDYMLKFSGSSAYVFPREFRGFSYLDMASDLRRSVPDLQHLIVAGTAVEGMHSLDDLYSCPPLAADHRVRMNPNEVYRMAFTSGTTGDPKCVLHSFNTTFYAPWLLNRDMVVTERDVLLAYLPVGLNWGYFTLLQTIMAGARAMLMERFSGRAALETIERERITYIPTAPASIVAMLADPELERFDLSSLRVVVTGGASAAIETIRDFQARAEGHLIELYGMLEIGFQTWTRFSDDPERVNGTIGRLIEGMELRILDNASNDVPKGQVGEIAARGPTIHLGYHNNRAANAASFTEDGWFRTGDLGFVVDDAGNVQLSGRSKEIINRGGKKFFPREVEEILYTHPSVLHAAMVGLPDARLGERSCLCVIPRHGRDLSLDEVVGFLKGQIADYKLPESIERFEEFPLTGSGKIRRHVLRDWVLARHNGSASSTPRSR